MTPEQKYESQLIVNKRKKALRIYGAVVRERVYQDSKWGATEEHPHEVGAWIKIMEKELQEAALHKN